MPCPYNTILGRDTALPSPLSYRSDRKRYETQPTFDYLLGLYQRINSFSISIQTNISALKPKQIINSNKLK